MPLPYHAGKAKLAKTISKMVYKKAEENPSIKNYAEPFSGMARVGIKVMEDDKNKVFKKYIFSDVNPTITVLFKALKKGWLPKTGAITQKKWESYKKNKKPSAQKSFVGYTLGFGGQYLGGSKPCANKHSVKTHSVTDWTEIMLKRKKKYLKGLQSYFKSSKFMYKEKSVFDLDYKDTIIYCDPPYVATAFRAKKIWDKEKEKKLWNTIKKWLEPSKNNIVILSNSKRTIKTKGLGVKKIYEDDVEYGSWKNNWKKRKEMIFEVVNTSGRKTRKKQRGGNGEEPKITGNTVNISRRELEFYIEYKKNAGHDCFRPGGKYHSLRCGEIMKHFLLNFVTYQRLEDKNGYPFSSSKIISDKIEELIEKNRIDGLCLDKERDGGCCKMTGCIISGGRRRKKKTRKKRGGTMNDKDRGDLISIAERLNKHLPPCYQPTNFSQMYLPTMEYCFILYLKSDTEIKKHLSTLEKESIDEIYNRNEAEINKIGKPSGCCTVSGGKRRKRKTRKK